MNKTTNVWVYYIKEKLKNNDTIIYREVKVTEGTVYIIYDSATSLRYKISEFIINPIIRSTKAFTDIEVIKQEVIGMSSVIDVDTKENAVEYILSGEVLIIFDFLDKTVTCHNSSFPVRSVETTTTETVIKGPRVGFNESIADDLALIKSRIKDPNLRFENFMLGEKSKTKVALVYIEGNAPKKLVDYVREKLKNVTSDYMIYANHIEEELKCKHTPFDTIGYTEKPDTIAIALAE